MALNKINDMTEGSILKKMLLFAVPLFIGDLFELLYSFTDTVISSHFIGTNALAAIGVTTSVNALILTFCSGMGSGACILVSKYFGSKDSKNIKNVIFSILVINIIMALVLSTIIILLTPQILNLMDCPEEIRQMADSYFRVMIIGMIGSLMYNTMEGILRAFGNSKTALIVLICMVLLNLGMDLIFVILFKMGIIGTALATVIAEFLAALILFIYYMKKYPEYSLTKEDLYFTKKNVLDVITNGLSIGTMNSVFTIGGILMSKGVNNLGTNIISANTASRKIIEIVMLPTSSLASASSVFVSQNYGAKNEERVKKGILISIELELIWSIILLLVFLFEKPLLEFISKSKDAEIINNAKLNLNYSLPFYFPLGILLVLRMSLQALEHKIIPLISSSIELIIKILAATIFIPKWEYQGYVIAEPISWVLCALFVGGAFWKLKDKNKLFVNKGEIEK